MSNHTVLHISICTCVSELTHSGVIIEGQLRHNQIRIHVYLENNINFKIICISAIVYSWTSTLLFNVHRVCGAIERRLSHFLHR